MNIIYRAAKNPMRSEFQGLAEEKPCLPLMLLLLTNPLCLTVSWKV